MQNKKYLSLLGLARRAGKLSLGHDAAYESLRKRKARLIIFSSDISNNVIRDFEKTPSSVFAIRVNETMEDFGAALGHKSGVLSVNDDGFAKRITELIRQEDNVYGDKD